MPLTQVRNGAAIQITARQHITNMAPGKVPLIQTEHLQSEPVDRMDHSPITDQQNSNRRMLQQVVEKRMMGILKAVSVRQVLFGVAERPDGCAATLQNVNALTNMIRNGLRIGS